MLGVPSISCKIQGFCKLDDDTLWSKQAAMTHGVVRIETDFIVSSKVLPFLSFVAVMRMELT
jgi:hypothetical protein